MSLSSYLDAFDPINTQAKHQYPFTHIITMLTLTTSTTARIVGRNAAVAKTSMLRTAAMSATSARRNQHTLPDLPYGYDVSQAVIDNTL